ncbi:MAG TPA: carbon-nitrogen hydrolase family protein [Phycisphaerae bacterium]|nr:carbon-nitrogen hydrolase family protein [Phycisphaerae bacterium]HUT57361.1 carbon-nitrogen hydrolase family protein [Phycisphaerae bacterium]
MSEKTDSPPRKVVVGTTMYAMWEPHPGLAKRMATLGGFVDQMAVQAKEKHGVGLDLAVLPENAVTGCAKDGDSAADHSVPLEGEVLNTMGRIARRNRTYLVVPMGLAEGGQYYNAAALLDRDGSAVGIYRKVHPVDSADAGVLEGGRMPGKDFPVFQCDFGTVGIQICFDIRFDDGWATLARKGAEIVAWPTQTPRQILSGFRARQYGYYVVSSTWRNNASLIDPTGAVAAQIVEPQNILVEQIDLSWVMLDWQPKLRNGEALRERYGEKVGFRYSEAEDEGLFWSNDPATPITQMVRELGLELPEPSIDRNRRLQDALRGGPPSLQ